MAGQIYYSNRQIELIRDSGRIVAECLEMIRKMVAPGITTLQLDVAATEFIAKNGGRSPFKGYELPGKVPFPASLCASVNDVIVHGIPDNTPLKAGDLVSIDIGCYKNGYIGDSAWTYVVGEPDEATQKLMAAGIDALYAGIAAMKPKGVLADASSAVQKLVEGRGYSVVRDYVGHGVGQSLHEEPQVRNYTEFKDWLPGFRTVLKPGMVLAIEPMVNEKGPKVKGDAHIWPVHTEDGGRSVHFEHTVAIMPDRVEILTKL